MAGQKNVVGSKFEDLRDIIELVENKDRVCYSVNLTRLVVIRSTLVYHNSGTQMRHLDDIFFHLGGSLP